MQTNTFPSIGLPFLAAALLLLLPGRAAIGRSGRWAYDVVWTYNRAISGSSSPVVSSNELYHINNYGKFHGQNYRQIVRFALRIDT